MCLEKLSSIVRSVSQHDSRDPHRSAQATPTPWDHQSSRERPRSRESAHRYNQRDQRDSHQRDTREVQRERIERLGVGSQSHHARNDSGATGVASSGEYVESHHTNGGRRHDYDVQSMEADLSSPRTSIMKNPIPPPAVTVRSEFPTLSRSRQQQSLTCLITIEVPDGKWIPDPDDLRSVPPVSSYPRDDGYRRSGSPPPTRQPVWSTDPPELLDEITEDLRVRVDNWHGLDFQR